MRFVVAVKQVPDTMDVRTGEDGSIVRADAPAILDPYSENALMKILSITGEGDEVLAVSMGPPHAEEALRRCIGLGADKAYLLTDSDFAGSDTWATARVLAAFIEKFVPDAGICAFGRQAIDGDTGQVPAEVACLLGVQQFCYTSKLIRKSDVLSATQDYGTFERECDVPVGSVVSFSEADACGTLMSIDGYIRSRNAEVVRLGRVDLGLGLYSVGIKGSLTRIESSKTIKDGRRNVKVEITDPKLAAEFIIKETRGKL